MFPYKILIIQEFPYFWLYKKKLNNNNNNNNNTNDIYIYIIAIYMYIYIYIYIYTYTYTYIMRAWMDGWEGCICKCKHRLCINRKIYMMFIIIVKWCLLTGR